MEPLLRLFTEMASARPSGFGAPQPISWADMAAWARLTDTALTAFDVRVLRLLDATWMTAWSDAQPRRTQSRNGRK